MYIFIVKKLTLFSFDRTYWTQPSTLKTHFLPTHDFYSGSTRFFQCLGTHTHAQTHFKKHFIVSFSFNFSFTSPIHSSEACFFPFIAIYIQFLCIYLPLQTDFSLSLSLLTFAHDLQPTFLSDLSPRRHRIGSQKFKSWKQNGEKTTKYQHCFCFLFKNVTFPLIPHKRLVNESFRIHLSSTVIWIFWWDWVCVCEWVCITYIAGWVAHMPNEVAYILK